MQLTHRQNKFKQREDLIFTVAEQLLIEHGDVGMTLEELAQELNIAKGTLYKHFHSKDELFLQLILRNEYLIYESMKNSPSHFDAQLNCLIHYHLDDAERTILYHNLEEKLSTIGGGNKQLFRKIYHIRKQRLKKIIYTTDVYLRQQHSKITVRDYLAIAWSLIFGGALLLNSSFYQRYLGSRETLKMSYFKQALEIANKK
ncbi:TetR/AcrR family transcriptional regulator [Acinetobacter sp. B5B]|uniref:TetR/AcrR family transcriptional regulator n=1 Tax=Acinetobacter baretiae TaxID=2605383 RepID=UPI0018C3320D|nr:TetR/AcrR family transcriptional regulator [Acinetobacter baretiae]MBF7683151.1 TetR/AcrR family transcriptional regulator [Acinetobacter baretiae]MBF7684545.1 TetR/AcrR family transcriptional regulator [Acinetobacter baretiae]